MGKRNRREVKKILENIDYYIPIIREYAENFKNRPHKPKQIYDGIVRKVRIIIVPTYMEQIIHHMMVQTLMPMFTKGMYEHSYGSIPKRGGHAGKKTIEKWIRKGGRNTRFCFKCDIKKYFDSIPHDKLKLKLASKIKDKKLLKVLFEIVDVIPYGLPLGFYTSQWLANWYLQELDHYIKEELKAIYYIRYMDDMVIFDSDKNKLHNIRIKIADYLNTLDLNMKENWQVFRFDYDDNGRFLDFMGYRFHYGRTILRKTIMLRACRKALKINKKKLTVYDSMQMLSYLGWIKSTDVYNMYLKHIKPYVDFGKCKNKISKYQRRLNKCRGLNIIQQTI